MSALLKHIAKQQDTAVTLSGVIEALAILKNEGLGDGAQTSLLLVAEALIGEIIDGLDSVRLPKGGEA